MRGHLVESAVGAYLLNLSYGDELELFWWRERVRGTLREVDFVVARDGEVTAIEVRSGRVKSSEGITEFLLRYPEAGVTVPSTAS